MKAARNGVLATGNRKMTRLNQSDLPDLARYPVSLQQTIAALWGVEAAERARTDPKTTTAGIARSNNRYGSGNF